MSCPPSLPRLMRPSKPGRGAGGASSRYTGRGPGERRRGWRWPCSSGRTGSAPVQVRTNKSQPWEGQSRSRSGAALAWSDGPNSAERHARLAEAAPSSAERNSADSAMDSVELDRPGSNSSSRHQPRRSIPAKFGRVRSNSTEVNKTQGEIGQRGPPHPAESDICATDICLPLTPVSCAKHADARGRRANEFGFASEFLEPCGEQRWRHMTPEPSASPPMTPRQRRPTGHNDHRNENAATGVRVRKTLPPTMGLSMASRPALRRADPWRGERRNAASTRGTKPAFW